MAGGFLRRSSLIFPVVLAATASVFCVRSGFFSFFFLLPLGLIAFWGEAKTAWGAGILAAAINIIVSLWFYMYGNEDPVFVRWNALYFCVAVLVFTWINAPLGSFWAGLDSTYRLAAGAVCCLLFLAPLFLYIIDNPQLRVFIASQIEALGNLPVSEASGVHTADDVLLTVVYLGLRGGLLISGMVFLWVNRQLSALLFRLVRRIKGRAEPVSAGNFLSFRVKPLFIWLLSFALGAILLGKSVETELVEIAGWNVLVLCAILFLVQGGAVMLYFFARLPPLLRILGNLGIIFLLFRPGINTAILVLLVFLGIAENWVSFRMPKEEHRSLR
ncbi:MAG: YybS family protein [Spirochaetaceae bacterium]|nr:YybS family protein [Spirochaetaceae bacterium]